MHDAAYHFVANALAALPTRPATVVEIGGRDINGSVRPLFGDADYTAIDLVNGPGVDVVADAVTWRPASPVECVVCCEVLEHAHQASALVAAALDMVRPRGLLIVTAAGPDRAAHSAFDGGPVLQPGEYYRGVSGSELKRWVHGAGVSAAVGVMVEERGDVRALIVRGA